MAKDFDIGQVQPLQGGSYQGQDAHITNPGQSNSMQQLVNAVGTFSEGVRRYAVNEQIEISEEQTQQVLANLHAEEAKGQATAADMVRNGQLALGANPYAAKAARRLFMQGIAKRAGDEIAQEYESSPVRNLGPDEVAQWTREQFAKRTKAMGFTDPHDAEFLDGFLPIQERAVEGLVGYHTKVAAQRTERDLKEGIAQNAGDVASANLLLPDVAARDVADNTLRAALMTGMAPRDAYENVLDGLISKAMAEGDVGYLDVAEQVPTLNDKSQEVPMGSRIWAQEKIAAARASLESQKAREAKAAADNQKLVLEQNKEASLAEAVDILHGGRSLPETAEVYEQFKRKAVELTRKGLLDPKLVPELDRMREEAVAANLKASERGEVIGDYGSVAHEEATQFILGGQVATLSKVAEMYAAPSMAPFRGAAFKTWNDWKKAQEVESDYNLKGMKLGILNDPNIKMLGAEKIASIESYWNGSIAAFKKERDKAGQAITVIEMNEFASNLADQVIARYSNKPDKNGDKLAPAKDYVESYGDTVRSALQNAKDKEEQNLIYNREIDAKVPTFTKDIIDLPKNLKDLGFDTWGDEAAKRYERHVAAITGVAENSGSADAIAAAKVLNEMVRNKIVFERQQAGTDQERARMGQASLAAYPRVEALMPMPDGMPINVISKLVKNGDAVIVRADGKVRGYAQGIYLKNPEAGMQAALELVQTELKATRRPDPKPDTPNK